MSACTTYVVHNAVPGRYYLYGPGAGEYCLEPLHGGPAGNTDTHGFLPLVTDDIKEIDHMMAVSAIATGGIKILADHVMGGGVLPSRVEVPAEQEPFGNRMDMIRETWGHVGESILRDLWAYGLCVMLLVDDEPRVLSPLDVQLARRVRRGRSEYRVTLPTTEWTPLEFLNATEATADGGPDLTEPAWGSAYSERTGISSSRVGDLLFQNPTISAGSVRKPSPLTAHASPHDPIASFGPRAHAGLGWTAPQTTFTGTPRGTVERREWTDWPGARVMGHLPEEADEAVRSSPVSPASRKRRRADVDKDDDSNRSVDGEAEALLHRVQAMHHADDDGGKEEEEDGGSETCTDDNAASPLRSASVADSDPARSVRPRRDPGRVDPLSHSPPWEESSAEQGAVDERTALDRSYQATIRCLDRRIRTRPTVMVLETHAPSAQGRLNSPASQLVNYFWTVQTLQSCTVLANKQLAEAVGLLEHVDAGPKDTQQKTAILARDMEVLMDVYRSNRQIAAFDMQLVQQFRTQALQSTEFASSAPASSQRNVDVMSGQHIIEPIDVVQHMRLEPLPPNMRFVPAPRPIPPPGYIEARKEFDFQVGVSLGVPIALVGQRDTAGTVSQQVMELFARTQRRAREQVQSALLQLVQERYEVVDMAYVAWLRDTDRLGDTSVAQALQRMRMHLMLPGMVNAPLVNDWYTTGMISAGTWSVFMSRQYGPPMEFFDGPKVVESSSSSAVPAQAAEEGEEEKEDTERVAAPVFSQAARRVPPNTILTNGPELRNANGSRPAHFRAAVPDQQAPPL